MSTSNRKGFEYRIPQSDSALSLSTCSSKGLYFRKRYQPAIPAPPDSPLDSKGLIERENWAKQMRSHKHTRNISPRLQNFIQRFAMKVGRLRKGTYKGNQKDELVEDVRTSDDMIQSRFQEVHGEGGLVSVLVEQLDAITEIRMLCEYGDLMAVSVGALKNNEEGYKDLIWNQEHKDWVAVANEIQNEETMKRDYKLNMTKKVETPYLDSVTKAAGLLKVQEHQILFEIKTYARRNEVCHSSIKNMIEKAQWPKLAERLVYDKSLLNKLFVDNPTDMLAMRNTIARIESRWFLKIQQDKDGEVYFRLSKEAEAKTNKKLNALELANS